MNVHAFRPIRSLFAPGVGIKFVNQEGTISIGLRWDGEFAKLYRNQKALLEATFSF